jgi:superfamily II DNA or RNA helicase
MRQIDERTRQNMDQFKGYINFLSGGHFEYFDEFDYKGVGVILYRTRPKPQENEATSYSYAGNRLFTGSFQVALPWYSTQTESAQAARTLIDKGNQALEEEARTQRREHAREWRDAHCSTRPTSEMLSTQPVAATDTPNEEIFEFETSVTAEPDNQHNIPEIPPTPYKPKSEYEKLTFTTRVVKQSEASQLTSIAELLREFSDEEEGTQPIIRTLVCPRCKEQIDQEFMAQHETICLRSARMPATRVRVPTYSGRQGTLPNKGSKLEDWFERLGLWAWQRKALLAWEREGHMGVVEAVTGTGKTNVGMAAAAWCAANGIKVLVIVPTTDLLRQWRKRLCDNLPWFNVGLLGDGKQGHMDKCDILVATIQSVDSKAFSSDPSAVRVPNGLVIADECHHYGSENWALSLDEDAYYRLGLTATYERRDSGIEDHLDRYFGGPCYSLQYKEALADDIIAHFKVAFLGVRFNAVESKAYLQADETVRKTQGTLIRECGLPGRPFGTFMKEVSELAKSNNVAGPNNIARKYLEAFMKRRKLLAEARGKVSRLLDLQAAMERAERTILFTQTKEATQEATRLLRGHGLSADSLYSGLSKSQRAQVLIDLDQGDIDVLSAPKLLDEGIDVPEADLGIIVAASSTRLQMVQRMGRILRKKTDGRLARIVIMYVEDTSEDPKEGAHEAFIDLIRPVAINEKFFTPSDRSSTICEYLNNW